MSGAGTLGDRTAPLFYSRNVRWALKFLKPRGREIGQRIGGFIQVECNIYLKDPCFFFVVVFSAADEVLPQASDPPDRKRTRKQID